MGEKFFIWSFLIGSNHCIKGQYPKLSKYESSKENPHKFELRENIYRQRKMVAEVAVITGGTQGVGQGKSFCLCFLDPQNFQVKSTNRLELSMIRLFYREVHRNALFKLWIVVLTFYSTVVTPNKGQPIFGKIGSSKGISGIPSFVIFMKMISNKGL